MKEKGRAKISKIIQEKSPSLHVDITKIIINLYWENNEIEFAYISGGVEWRQS